MSTYFYSNVIWLESGYKMSPLVLESSVRTTGLFRFDDRSIEFGIGYKKRYLVSIFIIYYKSYVNDDQCFNIS